MRERSSAGTRETARGRKTSSTRKSRSTRSARAGGPPYRGVEGFRTALADTTATGRTSLRRPRDPRRRRPGRIGADIHSRGRASGVELEIPLGFHLGVQGRAGAHPLLLGSCGGARRHRIASTGPDGRREGGRLLRRRDRRPRRRDRGDRASQRLLQRARADRPPDLARRALPPPPGRVPRRRPDRRLRRRGDGALRLRRRLRRQRRRAALGADPRPALHRAAAGPGAVRRARDRDHRLGAEVDRLRGPDGRARLRLARGDRRAAARALPDRLRGGLAAAAGRGGRRGRPGAAPARGPGRGGARWTSPGTWCSRR